MEKVCSRLQALHLPEGSSTAGLGAMQSACTVIAKAKKVGNFRKISTVVKSKTRKKEKNGSGDVNGNCCKEWWKDLGKELASWVLW